MLRSRKYTKKLQLYNSYKIADGFGGNTVSQFLITSLWAEVKTLNKFKYRNIDFGDIDMANSVEVTIRYRSDLTIDYKNMYFVYQGYRYSFTDVPVNTNFEKNELTFIMLKQNDIIKQPGYLDIFSTYVKSAYNESNGVISSLDCVRDTILSLTNE